MAVISCSLNKLRVTCVPRGSISTRYERELTAYKTKVVESIDASRLHLYDPPKTDDPYEIRFVHQEEKLHESRKEAMAKSLRDLKTDGVNSSQRRGYSWVAQGNPVPFSKMLKTEPVL